MIVLRRRTLAILLVIAAALGVGVGSWSAGPAAPTAPRSLPAALQAPVIPAALPLPSASFAQIAEAVSPAVININTVMRGRIGRTPIEEFFGEEFFRRFFGETPEREFQQRSLGSGVIVDASGITLTNAHVVERATDIEVVTFDGKKFKAKVVGTDRKTDLAVLRLEGSGPFPAATLGDSTQVKVGDWVLAIGSPFGLQQTVTAGIISAKSRVIGQSAFDDFLQTDAAINPGNSGGPLVNMRGEVIGINSAILSRSGGNVGIGFAIPVNLARQIYTELVAKGRVTRGWLGVSIQPLNPDLAKGFGLKEPKGVLIADVVQGSPAEKAGIIAGDIVIEFDRTTVDTPQDLQKVVATTPPGRGVPVRLWRDKAEKTVEIKVGEMPDEAVAQPTPEGGRALLGLEVRPLTPEVARQLNLRGTEGVVIVRVEDESPAAEAGIQRGDVIREINRERVRTLQDFERATKGLKEGDRVILLLQRGPQALYVGFTVAKG
jgi:serine protease Do